MFLASIIALDQYCIRSITEFQIKLLDPIMIAFTTIGNTGAIWLFGTTILLLWKKYQLEGRIILSGLIIVAILGEGILKHIFQRNRPFLELHEIVLKIPAPTTSSFPSGHTGTSWCFALLFTVFFWKRSKTSVVLVWILAIGVTISRIYLQVHYPTDILGGIIIAIISSIGAMYIWKNSETRKYFSDRRSK